MPPTQLEPDGSKAAAILAHDKLTGGRLLAGVSDWYERHLGQRLAVVPVLDQFKLVLEPLNSPFQVNILDAGEGLAQVLPILVAAAKAGRSDDEKTRILAAEEPESHLHPRLHGALAERFCELASQNMPPQLLLETHSENLLLRVQIQIVRGDIDPGRYSYTGSASSTTAGASPSPSLSIPLDALRATGLPASFPRTSIRLGH